MIKYNIPRKESNELYKSSKIEIINKNNTMSIKSIDYIYKDELILVESSTINLYNEKMIDRGLQIIMKYILINNDDIKMLYPRIEHYNTFNRTPLIKNIHKIIKNINNIKIKIFFNKMDKLDIEFYYAKYLFNAFDGYDYGPLTLPIFSKFNHSNNPNIYFKFNVLTGQMHGYAIHNIKPNNELFISYLNNIPKYINKNDYIFNHYGFNI